MSNHIICRKNMFINTETLTYAGGDSWRVSLPPAPFSCKANQRMKLTLLNMEIRKNWYEINQTNNTFFIQINNAGVYSWYPVLIPPGSYRAFGPAVAAGTAQGITANTAPSTVNYSYATNDLASAIKYGVDKTLYYMVNGGIITDCNGLQVNNNNYAPTTFFNISTGCTVSWNSVVRKFAINFPAFGANGGSALTTANVDIVFAQLKTNLVGISTTGTGGAVFNPMNNGNSSIYSNWNFQDSHEILGGIPTRSQNVLTVAPYFTPGMNKAAVAGTAVFTSPYVGQLNTLEGIYLRLFSSSTNNYQSPSMDRDSVNTNTLSPCNILARLPLTATVYDDLNEIISFTESGVYNFQIYLENKQLDNLQMSLTDDKNRPISEVALGEAANGTLGYKMTLMWEIEQLEFSTSSAPSSLDIKKSLSPVGFVGPNTDMGDASSKNIIYKKSQLSSFDPLAGNRVSTF